METIGIARQLVELRDPYTAGHENMLVTWQRRLRRKWALMNTASKG